MSNKYFLLPKKNQIFLFIQMIALLMGTSTHVAWVIKNGFLSSLYNAPLFSKLFWDALTFIDPLAAILLFLKPKIGVYLTLIIIMSDIIHNNIIYVDELYLNPPPSIIEWFKTYWMIAGQIGFGLFVILTFRSNLNAVDKLK